MAYFDQRTTGLYADPAEEVAQQPVPQAPTTINAKLARGTQQIWKRLAAAGRPVTPGTKTTGVSNEDLHMVKPYEVGVYVEGVDGVVFALNNMVEGRVSFAGIVKLAANSEPQNGKMDGYRQIAIMKRCGVKMYHNGPEPAKVGDRIIVGKPYTKETSTGNFVNVHSPHARDPRIVPTLYAVSATTTNVTAFRGEYDAGRQIPHHFKTYFVLMDALERNIRNQVAPGPGATAQQHAVAVCEFVKNTGVTHGWPMHPQLLQNISAYVRRNFTENTDTVATHVMNMITEGLAGDLHSMLQAASVGVVTEGADPGGVMRVHVC
jgi:hypothetical protein